MFEGLSLGSREQSVKVCLWSILVALCMATQVTASRAQNTIHVPADQPTIQAGINAASNGDTVLVAPGTYTENLDFKGKAITVTSGATDSAGAAYTVITGNQQAPAIIFQSGETRASVLNGFTIQNGLTGIYLPSSSATISNNLITSNIACGIAATGQAAGPLITGNTISHTRYIPNVNCITNSQPYGQFNASARDDAIWLLEAGNVEITANTIENNGVLIQTQGTIPEPLGEGIFSESVSSTTAIIVKSNVVVSNYLDDAAISIGQAINVTVAQNLVANNVSTESSASGIAANGGGGFAKPGSIYSLVIVNNTSYGNINVDDPLKNPAQTGNQGDFNTGQTIVNPFVIENNLFIATDKFGTVSCGASANSQIVYSNDDAFYAGAAQPSMCQGTGSGNLAADPEFLSPSTNNFFTQRTSPVVASGDVYAMDLPATDLAGKNRTVCGTVDMGVYEIHPIPAISLSSSPNPSVGGSSVTINASVAGNCNVPTGILTFYAGSAVLGTATLNSAGQAIFSTAALTVGSDTITATYPGDFNFDPSTSSPLIQVVTGYPTAMTLQVAPNPAKAFQSISFTGVVTSKFGVPSGTISFYTGTNLLGSAPVNGSGVASITLSNLGAGSYRVSAVYNASILFAASTSPIVQEVVNGVPTAIALSATPNPSSFGQSVNFTATVTVPQSTSIPTGSVTFEDGGTVFATAALSSSGIAAVSISSLAIGSHTITAAFGGSANDNPSMSNTVTQVVVPAPNVVILTGSPNPANVGETVTFVASVTPVLSGLAAPTGTITFTDQSGVLGTVPLNNGQAVFTTNSLAAGTHSVTAAFAGSGNYSGSISATLLEVIQNHDFSIVLASPSITVKSGQTASVNILLTSVGSYAGTLTLNAAQVPLYGSASFSPGSVSLVSSGSASSLITIQTAQLPPGVAVNSKAGGFRGMPVLFAALATLPFALFRRRSRLPSLLAIFVAFALLFPTTGCTNISLTLNKIVPGTYVIPITAADPGNQLTHSTNLTLIVTP